MTFYAAFGVKDNIYLGPTMHIGRTWRVEGYIMSISRDPLFKPLMGNHIGARKSMEWLTLFSQGGWEKGVFTLPDTEKPLFYLDPLQYLEIAASACDKEGSVVML